MKSVIVVGILSLALGTTEAVAVSCPTVPTSGSAGTYLTASQIRSLLNGRYACVGTFPNATWNERHNGASGPVTDFKKGPSDPVDPSKQVGSFSVTGTSFPGNVQGPGYVTYTYLNGGGTYDYYINNSNNLATTTSSAPAGIYTFCTRTAGTTVDVNVNAGNSTTGGC